MALGPWNAPGTQGAAVSPAVWSNGDVYSAVALPDEGLVHAELRWMRWRAGQSAVLDRRKVTGMAPGSAMALISRVGGGYTVVWLVPGDDGGVGAIRAIDVGPETFTSDERFGSMSEAVGARWIREVMARRERDHVEEPPRVIPSQAGRVSVDVHRGVVTVTAGGVEVTQGEDLMGFEQTVTATEAQGTGWVAVSRGRCHDARIEVYRTAPGVSTLRARFAMGAELGVRWIALDPHGDTVAVSWYQDLIPLRLACDRGVDAPEVTDQGVRVAVVSGG